MENESLGMAMAKLAKLAKTIPPSATTGQEKPVFSRFSQNSLSHPVKINFSHGPRVTVEKLPERLVNAATWVCTELWNDPPEAVQDMLEDLTWNDPADWPALILHFEAQLPPPPKAIPALVTCSGCSQSAPSPHHPAIMHCKASVESGAATGGWFATDRHLCDKREVRHAD